MVQATRSIFRADVLAKHLRATERPVLPPFVSPASLRFVWALLALLAAAIWLAWRSEIPVFARGRACTIEWDGAAPLDGERSALLVCAPALELDRLRAGQSVRLTERAGATPIRATIVAVERDPSSAEAIARRFGSSAAHALAAQGSCVVAFAHYDAREAQRLGGAASADVEVARESVLQALIGTRDGASAR
jgi:hypothetical protein